MTKIIIIKRIIIIIILLVVLVAIGLFIHDSRAPNSESQDLNTIESVDQIDKYYNDRKKNIQADVPGTTERAQYFGIFEETGN